MKSDTYNTTQYDVTITATRNVTFWIVKLPAFEDENIYSLRTPH